MVASRWTGVHGAGDSEGSVGARRVGGRAQWAPAAPGCRACVAGRGRSDPNFAEKKDDGSLIVNDCNTALEIILSSPDAGPYNPMSNKLGIPALEALALELKSGLDKALLDDASIV